MSLHQDESPSNDKIDKLVNKLGPSDKFIHDVVLDYRRRSTENGEIRDRERDRSRSQPPGQSGQQDEMSGAQRAMEAIWEAESAKARIYEISGKSQVSSNNPLEDNHEFNQDMQILNQGFAYSMMVDEKFMFVAAHVDTALKIKIQRGEYVRLSKLLAKDKLEGDEEVRMEMVNREGRPVWIPASGKDLTTINSYAKWEQAFRIYSEIYLKAQANAHRAPELLQYGHIIHTAALSYVWDNVYKYDRLFRLHIEQNPGRSWGIILQQAWSLCLNDKVTFGNSTRVPSSEMGKSVENRRNKSCYKYNRGKCTYGPNCKFEHKCLVCGKFGHGSHNCRRFLGTAGGQDKDHDKLGKKMQKPN